MKVHPSFGAWLALSLALVVACNDSDDGDTQPADVLPLAAQLMPNPGTGFVVFPGLTRIGATSTTTVAVLNGGQQTLDIAQVTLTGRDIDVITLEPVSTPVAVASRQTVGITLTFAPDARGVFLADLVVTSNAENLPAATFHVVGAAPADPLPAGADLALFEATPMTVVADVRTAGCGSEGALGSCPPSFVARPVTFVRFYNLGGQSLTIDRFLLDAPPLTNGQPSFSYVPGTPVPGVPCVGTMASCDGGLSCRAGACEALSVRSGGFVVVPLVNHGVELESPLSPATPASLTILSDDASSPRLSVTLDSAP